MAKKRPYTFINVAMTADGKIDTFKRRGAEISSEADWQRVDQLRAGSDGVLVGGRTLLEEDPRLIVKSPELRQERVDRGLSENPIKIGVISNAEISLDGKFMTAGPAEKFIFTTHGTDPAQIERLRSAGAEVFVHKTLRVYLVKMMSKLATRGVKRLMVEGGGTMNESLLRLGLVDEINVYIAPMIFGGADAPTFADGAGLKRKHALELELLGVETVDAGGVILRYHVLKKKEINKELERQSGE